MKARLIIVLLADSTLYASVQAQESTAEVQSRYDDAAKALRYRDKPNILS